MSHLARRLRQTGFGLGLLACGGDGNDTFSPSIAAVAGTYTATSFIAITDGVTRDLLAIGASVTATLREDGTTSGRMFVPGGAEDGSDLDADLAGTWVLAGTTVTFEQMADTFLNDVSFTVEPNRLRAQGTFGTTTLQITLTK